MLHLTITTGVITSNTHNHNREKQSRPIGESEGAYSSLEVYGASDNARRLPRESGAESVHLHPNSTLNRSKELHDWLVLHCGREREIEETRTER